MNKYIKWLLTLPFVLLVELIAIIVAPLVALFITKRMRTDRVKLIDKTEHQTMMREYLIDALYYFQTHDNAVDEYWWDAYFLDSPFFKNLTQDDYDSKPYVRWMMRVMWLWRNVAYGFNYAWFSLPNEDRIETVTGVKGKPGWKRIRQGRYSFQFQYNLPLWGEKYMSLNVGWKKHKGKDKMIFANRIIGPIRK